MPHFSILPRKFSSRLFIITLVAGLIPAVIFVLLIQLYGGRFEDLLGMTISAGHKEGWTQSDTLLREQGETLIRDKAHDIAFQLELVVRSVPWMTLRNLQRDPRFRDIAVQKGRAEGLPPHCTTPRPASSASTTTERSRISIRAATPGTGRNSGPS